MQKTNKITVFFAVVVYLVFEVAFTSYLVEFLGAPRTAEEIHLIEQNGRILTGVALALVLVGPIANRFSRRFGPSFAALGILVGFIIPLTFLVSYKSVAFVIEGIVTHIVDRTSPEQRRQAIIANVLVERLHAIDDKVPILTLNGDYVPSTLGADAEGRVLLAAMPFLMYRVPDLEGKVLNILEQTFRRSVIKEIGSAEKAYNEMFVRPMRDLIAPTYSGFAKAVNSARRARFDLTHRADQEFDEYREELAKARVTIDQAKRIPIVRKRVAQRLIERSHHFRAICDRKGVADSVTDFDQVLEATIQDEFTSALTRLKLRGLATPEGEFSFAQFIETEPVRSIWRQEVSEKVGGSRLGEKLELFGPRLGEAQPLLQEFRRVVLDPYVTELTSEKIKALKADVASYTSDTALGEQAYSATKAIVVIPIAMLFSMLGALTHATKITGLSLNLSGLRATFAWSLSLILLAIGISTAYENRGRTFASWGPSQQITEAVRRDFGAGAETLLRTVIAVQSFLYPIGTTIRETIVFTDPTPNVNSTQ